MILSRAWLVSIFLGSVTAISACSIGPQKAMANHFKTPLLYPAAPALYSVASGDLNGDGVQDLVAFSLGHASPYLWSALLLPSGEFLESVATPMEGGTWEGLLGDFDEDDTLDVVAPSAAVFTYTGHLSFYAGGGDGTFSLSRSDSTVQLPSASAMGDVNSDGHLDVAVADWQADIVAVHLGVGDGSFRTRFDFPTGVNPTDVALADLDRDGNLDAVVTYVGPGGPFGEHLTTTDSVAVHMGLGDGHFSARESYRAGRWTYFVATGDLNHDAAPDLAVACQGESLAVLLGHGDGTFDAPNVFPTGKARWVAIGDIDGDGWNDIAATIRNDSTHTSKLAVLMNQQDGSFNGPEFEPAGTGANGVLLLDITGDGKADAFIADDAGSLAPVGEGVLVMESCSPCVPTAIEVALLESSVDPSGVHVTWSVSDRAGAFATIERSMDEEHWVTRLAPTPILSSTLEFTDSDVEPGTRYAYRLTVRRTDGSTTRSIAWVEVPVGPVPRVVELASPVPNPTAGPIRITFGMPTRGDAQLSVFDVSGRLVKRLPLGTRDPGWMTIPWDGRNDAGMTIAAGAYFLKLQTPGTTVSRKLVVLH